MKIETLPLIIGVLVAMLAIGLIFDAWTPDATVVSQERRRRQRIERHRNGEALIGFGVLALAAAFMGRDNWRYSILVVIVGVLFLIVGTVLNAQYVRELFVNRGPLRRREQAEDFAVPPNAAEVTADQARIETEVPTKVHAHADWDGVERRSTPRERTGRKSADRNSTSKDSPPR